MKRLAGYLRPHIGKMSIGLLIKGIGTIMDLFLPWILSYIIDTVIPKENRSEIFLWGGLMIVCSVIAVTFNIRANRMASAVARDCTRTIRHDLYTKISYLDAAQVDRLTISSLESRLTGDTYNVNQMIGGMQRLGVRAPILLLGGITITFLLDPRLTLVMVCTMPFIALSIIIISKKGIPLYTKLQQSIDQMTRVVRENASGVRIIKALGKSDHEKERFDKVNQDAVEKEKTAGLTMAATNPLITLFLNAGLTAVIIVGAHLVYGGLSSAGKIIAFMSYFTIISNAMLSVSRMFTMLSKGAAGMGRISAVLDEEPTLWVESSAEDQPVHTNITDPLTAIPQIEFKNVSFAFDGAPVLQNISFKLQKGQTLGLIGATGSGKSTLIALLLRIYAPDSGEILIDGQPIEKIPTPDLRRQFGVVFQNDFLFADTIRENVNFGRNLSDQEIAAALSDAQAAEFISTYSDGDSHLLDIKGANLSGGQKQRLLVARALAGNPDILILDDSSSALDYRTDAALRTTIAKKYAAATTLLVAQRISSIAHADEIIMLENGRVLGKGSHAELLNSCPPYREIAETQMGGGMLLE